MHETLATAKIEQNKVAAPIGKMVSNHLHIAAKIDYRRAVNTGSKASPPLVMRGSSSSKLWSLIAQYRLIANPFYRIQGGFASKYGETSEVS